MAALVLVGVIALLVYLNRYELFRERVETSGLPPAVQDCVTERLSRLDDQISRGLVTQEMAAPIRESVVNFCRETVGEGG
ncbi:hypothetical protein N177_4010 [Lutibaculum baratangense AMV1]|uniref:Uncharacterized protein n=1 Tax=Lutibaculum baratangense AMV1 TaxID=631454 RepID=V4T8K6_9HYPH|nr:hypothetical protein N177_4010 [Lutibaculum baratangense AMV1]